MHKHQCLDFINVCWKTGHIPEEWKKTKVVPIIQKSDHNDSNNYMRITLLNACYNLYALNMRNRRIAARNTKELLQQKNDLKIVYGPEIVYRIKLNKPYYTIHPQ